LTLVDDEGNTVTLPARPARIVSLTPATTETLFALGAGDRVVADTDFDDYPAQVKQLPHVASFSSVDVEKIVSLRPDLVLAGGNGFNAPDAIAKLRELGVPVLVVYAKDVAGVLSDIRLVGTAAGEAAAADSMTSDMRSRIDAIAAAVAPLDHPRTFYELDATKEIYGPADDSFVAEMVKLAGGDPITTGSASVFSIPLEKLVAADPQVIVLGDANYGTTPKDVAARPGWSGMTAVKSGAVRPVDDTVVTRPGPRLVEGLVALERAIHPEAPVFPPAASESPPPPAAPSAATGSSTAP
jgi:iron complex transport system substrate-binding protein